MIGMVDSARPAANSGGLGAPRTAGLHLVAATAYRDGHTRTANALLQIADAAEQELASGGGYAPIDIFG